MKTYCDSAKKFQSVPNYSETKANLISQEQPFSDEDISRTRLGTQYSSPDNYIPGAIQDNRIFVATTDPQHNQIVNMQTDPQQKITAHGGLSGYFSDQATVDACKDENGVLDNTKYNQMEQIAPYQNPETGEVSYKPHIDAFDIDRDALYSNYGTHDFDAAISKCEANNQWGAGGGNQGYSPYINDMVENGTLKHVPEDSYSDAKISNSDHCNPNELKNSTVSSEDYNNMLDNNTDRNKDCIKNDTPHPSAEACENGFEHNTEPIATPTGNAKVYGSEKPLDESNLSEKNTQPTNKNLTPSTEFDNSDAPAHPAKSSENDQTNTAAPNTDIPKQDNSKDNDYDYYNGIF